MPLTEPIMEEEFDILSYHGSDTDLNLSENDQISDNDGDHASVNLSEESTETEQGSSQVGEDLLMEMNDGRLSTLMSLSMTNDYIALNDGLVDDIAHEPLSSDPVNALCDVQTPIPLRAWKPLLNSFSPKSRVLKIVFSGDYTPITKLYIERIYSRIPDVILYWHNLETDTVSLISDQNESNTIVEATTRVRFWGNESLGTSEDSAWEVTKASAPSFDYFVALPDSKVPVSSIFVPFRQWEFSGTDLTDGNIFLSRTESRVGPECFRRVLYHLSNERLLLSRFSSLQTPEQRLAASFPGFLLHLLTLTLVGTATLAAGYFAYHSFAAYKSAGLVETTVPDSSIKDSIPCNKLAVTAPAEVSGILAPLILDLRVFVQQIVERARVLLAESGSYVGNWMYTQSVQVRQNAAAVSQASKELATDAADFTGSVVHKAGSTEAWAKAEAWAGSAKRWVGNNRSWADFKKLGSRFEHVPRNLKEWGSDVHKAIHKADEALIREGQQFVQEQHERVETLLKAVQRFRQA